MSDDKLLDLQHAVAADPTDVQSVLRLARLYERGGEALVFTASEIATGSIFPPVGRYVVTIEGGPIEYDHPTRGTSVTRFTGRVNAVLEGSAQIGDRVAFLFGSLDIGVERRFRDFMTEIRGSQPEERFAITGRMLEISAEEKETRTGRKFVSVRPRRFEP